MVLTKTGIATTSVGFGHQFLTYVADEARFIGANHGLTSITDDATTGIFLHLQLLAFRALGRFYLGANVVLTEVAFAATVIRFSLERLTGSTIQLLFGWARVFDALGARRATTVIVFDV